MSADIKDIDERKLKKAQYQKAWYKANRDKMAAKNKAWYKANKKEIISRNSAYRKIRKSVNPLFKASESIRKLIGKSIKSVGLRKNTKTAKILGCTFQEFKEHIESQFLEGMTWENHGEWHIDHVIPSSRAKNYAEIISLNHYTNLRPLWAEDNLKKSDS